MDLSGINPETLKQHIGSINPTNILGQLGINEIDANNIMNGDLSSLQHIGPDILNCDLIIERFHDSINVNLINYFFKKVKNKEAFTEDELNAYKEAYQFWFELIFKVGKGNTFQLSDELKDESVLIKKDDYYIMTQFDNIYQIIHLGNKI